MFHYNQLFGNRTQIRNPYSKSDSSVEATGGAAFRFPIKQAATAVSATLAVTGDTIAQLSERWVNNKSSSHPFKEMSAAVVQGNDQVDGHIISMTVGGRNGEPKRKYSVLWARFPTESDLEG